MQIALLAGALTWSGCASTRHENTVSMLSAAGFRSMTPRTAQQQADFAALPAYQLVRHDSNGQAAWVYADERNGILYKGDESNYQRFQQLAFQQRIADQQVAAAQMNQQAAMGWGWYWGPGGPPGSWW